MVRYQAANGNAAARLATRDKHFILFDSPADKGAELKTAYPAIGWAASIEGYPTLPFSVGARLILQVGAEATHRDQALTIAPLDSRDRLIESLSVAGD